MSTTVITREQLASYLRGLFVEGRLVSKEDLVEALKAKEAPSELVELIATRIPADTRMTSLRTVWTHLPDVAVS